MEAQTRIRRPLTRRFKGEDGKLVTFLPTPELAELVEVSRSTICRWANAGVMRSSLLRNKRYSSVLDATRLRLLTPAEDRALGIARTPASYIAQTRGWHAEQYGKTLPTAEHAHEVWDSYDICKVIDLHQEGISITEIAKELGRTYDSIVALTTNLHQTGDLPNRPQNDNWIDMALALLTEEEVAELEESLPA